MISVIEQRVAAGNDFDGTSGAATGSITTVAGSALTSGDAFYLKDGKGPEVRFEFVTDTAVSDARTVSPGTVIIPFNGSQTADQIRDLVAVSVNSCQYLALNAANGGAATVNLTNKRSGTHGNVTPTADAVVDAGFVVSAMTGGVNAAYSEDGHYRVYDMATSGGIFEFPFQDSSSPVSGAFVQAGVLLYRVESLMIDGDGNYTVNALGPNGSQRQLATGSVPALLGPFDLDGEEVLQLVTSTASAALTARAVAVPRTPLKGA